MMSGSSTHSTRLAVELRHEAGRLTCHPLREIERLEHEAMAGQTAATPAIMVAGMAIILSGVVAIVIAVDLVAATLLGG